MPKSKVSELPKVDPEMEQFQADMLQSVREYKAGHFARTTVVKPTDAMQARARMALSQPQFAKLLGVLSLQALPRRLLLDFRDVFSAGFAFDTIRGDVLIQQGIATTRNLQMKGVNAVVQMDGSSDIARETQNLRVLILPEVDAGTASLLAGIALNPAIGLSTFLAQLILKQPLSRVNTQEFLIDGTWSDPRVTKVVNSAATP